MCRWPPSTDIQSGTGTLNSTTLRAHPAAGGSLEDVTVLAVPPTHSDLDEAFVDTWADTILNKRKLSNGLLHVGWVNAKSGDPVDDKDAKAKYEFWPIRAPA